LAAGLNVAAAAVAVLRRESAGMGGPLNEEEAHVIQGVLDLSSKTGNKAMTPLDKVAAQ
jgi:CBS domain containing-hemolysin-like protein